MSLTYTMLRARNEAAIVQLQDSVRPLASLLVQRAKEELALDLLVTNTYRTASESTALKTAGAFAAPGGLSWHNYRLALDIVPVKSGKAWYEAPQETWDALGRLGESIGFVWGGRWKERDMPHFEYHPGVDIREMLAWFDKTGKIKPITVTVSLAGILLIASLAWALWAMRERLVS